MTLSRGGLRPPQQTSKIQLFTPLSNGEGFGGGAFVSLVAAEAGDLRYYIYLSSATSLTGMALYRFVLFPDEPDTNR